MHITTDGSTLFLYGDLDARCSRAVRNAVYDHLEDQDADLVLDLSGVTGVDLTALRVLAVASRAATRRGQHLTLRGCGPTLRRMLQVTHLSRVLDVEPAASTA